MGLFVRQEDERTPFQEKLAAELRQRSKQNADLNNSFDPTQKSNYLKGTEMLDMRGFAIAGVIILAVGILIAYIIFK